MKDYERFTIEEFIANFEEDGFSFALVDDKDSVIPISYVEQMILVSVLKDVLERDSKG